MKRKLKVSLLLLITLLFCIQPGFTLYARAASYPSSPNGYSSLLMPTQVTKVNNTYFILDCYHNQVIYSDNIGAPIKQWKLMTNNVYNPHALASDGEIYLVVDTENHRVLSYEKTTDRFNELQQFKNIGIRPHYAVYDAPTATFYVWSSLTGEMYLFRRLPGSKSLYLAQVKCVPQLNGVYVRSFTISGNDIFLPAVEYQSILQIDKETFAIKASYPVPENIAGMVQLSVIGNYFYLTVSSDLSYHRENATILRTKDLSLLQYGQYEDLKHLFGNNGTPYYLSHFDGSYYLIHEDAPPNIYKFDVKNDIICNIKGMH